MQTLFHFGQFDPPEQATYDWDYEAYVTPVLSRKNRPNSYESVVLAESTALLLKQIENVLDYIVLLRDKWACLKAEQLREVLVRGLEMEITVSDKAQFIRNQCLEWAAWMQAVYPGRDLLREECCTLGIELVRSIASNFVL